MNWAGLLAMFFGLDTASYTCVLGWLAPCRCTRPGICRCGWSRCWRWSVAVAKASIASIHW